MKWMGSCAVFFAVGLGAAATSLAEPPASSCKSGVVINRECITPAMVEKLASEYLMRIPSGRYWYDKRSGLAGVEGQPPMGFFAADMPIGGSLRRDAAGGTTKVFINGRELHAIEVALLQQMGPVIPGKYWLDSAGNVGLEGSPVPFANLVAIARQSQAAKRGGAKDNWHGNNMYHTYSNSAGGCSYVSVPGGSVMTGNCQ